MSHATHYETRPEDRIPFAQKVIYGLGAFVNNLLASSGNLIVPVLNIGFGMNPALAGLAASLPRLTDAVTDPLMGYISDNTKSRWGRRRPFIFVGAILAGIMLILLWQLPDGKSESYYFWHFLILSLFFFLAYTVYATPWVALGYELTPDYHERTRLMGVQNFIGQPVWMIAGYYVWFTQSDYFGSMQEGAAGLAIIMGIVVIVIGILPAVFLRERFKEIATSEAEPRPLRLDNALSVENAEEQGLRAFIGVDSDYYVEKWSHLPGASGLVGGGFNWAAFVLGPLWLLYRKMYSRAAIVLVLSVAVFLFLQASGGALLQALGFAIDKTEWFVSLVAGLLIATVYGIFGNRWYLSSASKAIADIPGRGLENLTALARRGGTIASRWPGVEDFFSGFAMTIRFSPFRKLCIATFLVFNGFQLIASFQIYVLSYYVFDGDVDLGSMWTGHALLIGALSTLLIIPFITWLGTKIGKRRALVTAIVISMIGYGSKWFLYSPATPWTVLIPAPLQAFGLGALFTITPSMIADVVDMDELTTHERREGMFGSIFWWVVKLGLAVALALSGVLLNWTGFDVDLNGNQAAETIMLMRGCDAFIPVITSAIAVWAVLSFPITEERAYEIRQELEQRRGTPDEPLAQPE